MEYSKHAKEEVAAAHTDVTLHAAHIAGSVHAEVDCLVCVHKSPGTCRTVVGCSITKEVYRNLISGLIVKCFLHMKSCTSDRKRVAQCHRKLQ